LKKSELKSFLDEAVLRYERPDFIPADPIWIPHQYEQRSDIEIMAFLISILAWGQRMTILNKGKELGRIFCGQPTDFILSGEFENNPEVDSFVHRTFNGTDLNFFLRTLRNIYQEQGGLEPAFSSGQDAYERIENFRSLFLSTEHEKRSHKHLASPASGSSAKRINMFLRWMVRSPQKGVDFGIWTDWKTSELMQPLDVHTARTGRQLGLLTRTQNDWKAVEELTERLRRYDPDDPVKYDFALFGLGVEGIL
jgi:uncharacterized protein (TIGR02757 family)